MAEPKLFSLFFKTKSVAESKFVSKFILRLSD